MSSWRGTTGTDWKGVPTRARAKERADGAGTKNRSKNGSRMVHGDRRPVRPPSREQQLSLYCLFFFAFCAAAAVCTWYVFVVHLTALVESCITLVGSIALIVTSDVCCFPRSLRVPATYPGGHEPFYSLYFSLFYSVFFVFFVLYGRICVPCLSYSV